MRLYYYYCHKNNTMSAPIFAKAPFLPSHLSPTVILHRENIFSLRSKGDRTQQYDRGWRMRSRKEDGCDDLILGRNNRCIDLRNLLPCHRHLLFSVLLMGGGGGSSVRGSRAGCDLEAEVWLLAWPTPLMLSLGRGGPFEGTYLWRRGGEVLDERGLLIPQIKKYNNQLIWNWGKFSVQYRRQEASWQ